MNWLAAFSRVPTVRCLDNGLLVPLETMRHMAQVQDFLTYVHIKFCLLKPFAEHEQYPVVDARDLLPSFEPTLYEYATLPGFSWSFLTGPSIIFRKSSSLICCAPVATRTSPQGIRPVS